MRRAGAVDARAGEADRSSGSRAEILCLQVNRQVSVSASSGLTDRAHALPTSYPVGYSDP